MKVLKITKKHKTKTYHLLMEVTHEELRESGGVISPVNFMYMAMADDTSDFAESIVTAPKELRIAKAARKTLIDDAMATVMYSSDGTSTL